MNEDNMIINKARSLSPTITRHTNTSSMIVSAIHCSGKTKTQRLFNNQLEQHINKDTDTNRLLSIRCNQTNNSPRRLKLGIKANQKKTTFNKNSRKLLTKKSKKQKLRTNKRSSQPNKTKQQHKLKAIKQVKIKSAQNKKNSTMISHQILDKPKKSRGNSTTRTIGHQHSVSQSKLSDTSTSNPQSRQETEAKQHVFLKRDRTASLMALQTLAKKIAIYKEKYGDIEIRHSSIVAPPKSRQKHKQRKKR